MKIQLFIIGLVIGGFEGFGLTKIYISYGNTAMDMNNNFSNIVTNNPDTIKWKREDSLDAVKAAPKSHHVIFENDKIRILEVMLQPYAKEPVHTHQWSSVMFGNNQGDTSQFDIIYYRYDYDSIHHRYFVKDSIEQHNGGAQQTIITMVIS